MKLVFFLSFLSLCFVLSVNGEATYTYNHVSTILHTVVLDEVLALHIYG